MNAGHTDENKAQPVYAPVQLASGGQRVRSLRARIFLHVVVTAAVLFGLHYHFLDDLEPSLVPRHPRTSSEEFDWYAVGSHSIRQIVTGANMLCIPLCQLEPSNHLEWTPCYTKEKCARLLVPLDYDTPDGPAAAIAVRMIPATDKENYRGTIFVNPGGPGGAATYLVGRRGEQLSSIVGPSFDILGFDPRGTGWSTPTARCFDTDSDREIWNVQEGHSLLNASEPSVGLFHARAKLLAQRCEHKIGGEWGIGRFVSTANVARDMLEISQMLGQDQVQFWGFVSAPCLVSPHGDAEHRAQSYGSVLGQYFAAMYPDKVKRVVVDGVYDAENYRATLWNTNLVDAELQQHGGTVLRVRAARGAVAERGRAGERRGPPATVSGAAR